jgi:hypothetical protein
MVSYVRDRSIQTDKFSEFDRMIRESRGIADAIAVAAPEVLGDTYEELVTNVGKLANAELMLIVVPSGHRQSGYKLN